MSFRAVQVIFKQFNIFPESVPFVLVYWALKLMIPSTSWIVNLILHA